MCKSPGHYDKVDTVNFQGQTRNLLAFFRGSEYLGVKKCRNARDILGHCDLLLSS